MSRVRVPSLTPQVRGYFYPLTFFFPEGLQRYRNLRQCRHSRPFDYDFGKRAKANGQQNAKRGKKKRN
jgi:hypothetical protein